MLYRIPKLLSRWSAHHKNYVQYIIAIGLSVFASPIIYAILPIIAAAAYGEWRAGILISGFGFAQAFLFDPIAGSLADKIGSRRTVLIGLALGICAGLVWITFSIQHLSTLLAFSFLLFLSYGFRGTAESYVLKTSKKDEGGLLFGIYGNISSLAIFIATVSLPFFVLSNHHDLAALNLIIIYATSFIILLFLPNEGIDKQASKISFWKALNPIPSIKHGLHFVRINDGYPALSLGASLFEGLFYGTIWFIFPLHMAKVGLSGAETGMHLGVYDLVTALFAGYAGYLADKYNWRHTHSLGWIFVVIGLIALPFYSWPTWLIIVGFVIAIGNNLSYYAAAHALEAHDIDHREDGSFIGLKTISNSLGYAVAPILAGYLYSQYGFATSLGVNSFLCAIIAFAMIWLTWKIEDRIVK